MHIWLRGPARHQAVWRSGGCGGGAGRRGQLGEEEREREGAEAKDVGRW